LLLRQLKRLRSEVPYFIPLWCLVAVYLR